MASEQDPGADGARLSGPKGEPELLETWGRKRTPQGLQSVGTERAAETERAPGRWEPPRRRHTRARERCQELSVCVRHPPTVPSASPPCLSGPRASAAGLPICGHPALQMAASRQPSAGACPPAPRIQGFLRRVSPPLPRARTRSPSARVPPRSPGASHRSSSRLSAARRAKPWRILLRDGTIRHPPSPDL